MEQESQESVAVDNAMSSQVGLSHIRKVAEYERENKTKNISQWFLFQLPAQVPGMTSFANGLCNL